MFIDISIMDIVFLMILLSAIGLVAFSLYKTWVTTKEKTLFTNTLLFTAGLLLIAAGVATFNYGILIFTN